jgi:demethylmenaquinone methyltransferase/2-methoxy-6-polyprenyl-1,4-benzoquinol methylase
LRRADTTALDLCCGTGDVLFDLEKIVPARVLGADFCHPMLVMARKKAEKLRLPAVLFEADAVNLPLKNESLDGIAIAFGFRNLSNYQTALTELARILRPGGVLAILEFSHPPGLVMKALYGLYSRVILPAIGGAISGSRDAYAYLPESIRKFPRATELCRMITASGFSRAE